MICKFCKGPYVINNRVKNNEVIIRVSCSCYFVEADCRCGNPTLQLIHQWKYEQDRLREAEKVAADLGFKLVKKEIQ